jgi:hypothetical protein
MALHRDIFWIGRQWAVTGFGMQAVNQKRLGQFDIEIARLWDDDWLDVLRVQPWLNAEDFAKGLAVARKRFPEPAHKPPSLPIEALLQVIAAPATPPEPKPTLKPGATKAVEPAKPAATMEPEPVVEPVAAAAIEPTKPIPPFLQMTAAAPTARLIKIWRIQRWQ